MTRADPSPAREPQTVLTVGGRAPGHRALARLPAAGSGTGQPPSTRSWPGPDNGRSPSAALGGKREARPLHAGGKTRLQGSPAPGLTCPTAHRAGPPNGGPRPGLSLLRPEVGEGDIWACEGAILLTVTPINLYETHGSQGALSRGVPEGRCHRHLAQKPQTFHFSISIFFSSAHNA